MIPKIIHYCWFGGNPLPELALKCIESWKKYLPDYEIKEWNESNFDVNCNDYVKEAYEAKKWAFVSDYARFKILYEHGGVYFDTDVEVIKDMSDILARGCFMGVEEPDRVATGLGLSAMPSMPLYKEILDDYDRAEFKRADGSLDLTTVVERITDIMARHGFSTAEAIIEISGVYIYPKDYFNPIDMKTGRRIITENTVSIHHYMASWESEANLRRGKIYKTLRRLFGKRGADFVRKIFGKKK